MLPLLLRCLLACVPLAGRREEVEADLAELFESAPQHGRLHASWRLLRDILSVISARPCRQSMSSRPRCALGARGRGCSIFGTDCGSSANIRP